MLWKLRGLSREETQGLRVAEHHGGHNRNSEVLATTCSVPCARAVKGAAAVIRTAVHGLWSNRAWSLLRLWVPRLTTPSCEGWLLSSLRGGPLRGIFGADESSGVSVVRRRLVFPVPRLHFPCWGFRLCPSSPCPQALVSHALLLLPLATRGLVPLVPLLPPHALPASVLRPVAPMAPCLAGRRHPRGGWGLPISPWSSSVVAEGLWLPRGSGPRPESGGAAGCSSVHAGGLPPVHGTRCDWPCSTRLMMWSIASCVSSPGRR